MKHVTWQIVLCQATASHNPDCNTISTLHHFHCRTRVTKQSSNPCTWSQVPHTDSSFTLTFKHEMPLIVCYCCAKLTQWCKAQINPTANIPLCRISFPCYQSRFTILKYIYFNGIYHTAAQSGLVKSLMSALLNESLPPSWMMRGLCNPNLFAHGSKCLMSYVTLAWVPSEDI